MPASARRSTPPPPAPWRADHDRARSHALAPLAAGRRRRPRHRPPPPQGGPRPAGGRGRDLRAQRLHPRRRRQQRDRYRQAHRVRSGPFTGLATLVAEEMDADWSQMRAEHAPPDVKLYANLAFGVQGTGGSTAMANSFDQIRKAAATARLHAQVQAAAQAWKVPAGEITIEAGVLKHASGSRAASATSPRLPPSCRTGRRSAEAARAVQVHRQGRCGQTHRRCRQGPRQGAVHHRHRRARHADRRRRPATTLRRQGRELRCDGGPQGQGRGRRQADRLRHRRLRSGHVAGDQGARGAEGTWDDSGAETRRQRRDRRRVSRARPHARHRRRKPWRCAGRSRQGRAR